MGADSLLGKYEELIALRREREALEARGVLGLEGAEDADRKARCRRLATAFPGSLRELETFSATALERRLEHVRTSDALAEFIDRYHALGRAMAALKRWQGAFRRRHQRRPSVGEARAALDVEFLTDAELADWLNPGDGRVHDRVWRRLAQERGESVVDCRKRFFATD